VSSLNDSSASFHKFGREKGKLDVVFPNAGVAKYAPLGTITEEFYHSIFNTNVKSVLFTVQHALPLMPDGARSDMMASRSCASSHAPGGVSPPYAEIEYSVCRSVQQPPFRRQNP
jgi:NAD(P)-dependent dehydrogenase (short-subunit alcohol dehydrogenase family)